MSAPKSTPSLHIPASEHTVSVSIIDTTTSVNGLPVAAFMNPQIARFATISDGVSYGFIVKHHNSAAASSKYDTLLFDLGARKDFENSPTAVIEASKAMGFSFNVEKNVFDILKDNGDDPTDVGAIIWSHYHTDHTGDPSVFPASTDLIVGPGFKQNLVPGWPTKPDSQLDEKAWKDRELIEVDFESDPHRLILGQYKAVDFYGDGSFYLIDSPGHAIGHMCALARTSADPPEYILMGADIAHHGGELRPTQQVPLPDQIDPNPLVAPFAESTAVCAGELFQSIHPKKSATEPFMEATGFIHDDAAMACDSINKVLGFDGQENIFTVLAHDKTLADVVEFYPKTADDWKKRGWKEQSFWRFLADFDTGSAGQAST